MLSIALSTQYPRDIHHRNSSRSSIPFVGLNQDAFVIRFKGKPTLEQLLGRDPDELYYHTTWSPALPGIKQAGSILPYLALEAHGIKRVSGEHDQLDSLPILRNHINVGKGSPGLGTVIAYADFYTSLYRYNQRLLTDEQLQQEYELLRQLTDEREWEVNYCLVYLIEKEIEHKIEWNSRGPRNWNPLDGNRIRAEHWKALLESELQRRELQESDCLEEEMPYPVVFAIDPKLVTLIGASDSGLPGDCRLQEALIESAVRMFVPRERLKEAEQWLRETYKASSKLDFSEMVIPLERLKELAVNDSVIEQARKRTDHTMRYLAKCADDINRYLWGRLPVIATSKD